MAYELERQQKERRTLFELEMQKRIEYLEMERKIYDFADYKTHSLRQYPFGNPSGIRDRCISRSPSCASQGVNTLSEQNADINARHESPLLTTHFHHAETHLPNSLEDWCRR